MIALGPRQDRGDAESGSAGDARVPRTRPGPLRRLWLREVRGWPRDLALDPGRAGPILDLAADPMILQEAGRRVRASDPVLGRFPIGLLTVDLATYAILVVLIITQDLGVILGWLAVLVVVELVTSRLMLRRFVHPTLRAILRGTGVDCCVRCGHVVVGSGGDGDGGERERTAAVRCPECGQHHDDLPLHWSRDLARP